MPLHYCPKCKENSVVRKSYTAQQAPGEIRVAEYCINKGCGYREAWIRNHTPDQIVRPEKSKEVQNE